jgi:hypothetical protein
MRNVTWPGKLWKSGCEDLGAQLLLIQFILKVDVAAVANTNFYLPGACVTDIRSPSSEKGTYVSPPHSLSHTTRDLNNVLAFNTLAGSKLTSVEGSHARARDGKNRQANNGASHLSTADVLTRLQAGL